jgi:hypothetical protein
VLIEQWEAAWRALEDREPLEAEPRFTSDSLVLGAGTVLLRRVQSGLDDPEPRLLVLLAAAYGVGIDLPALRHVRRATKVWLEGDFHLASMHLALAGLGRLHPARPAARRLFAVDCILEAGADPAAVLSALGLPFETLRRRYNPDEPRVPAGNQRISGEWTSGYVQDAGEPGAPVGAKAPFAASRAVEVAERVGSRVALSAGRQAAKQLVDAAIEQIAGDAGKAALSFGLFATVLGGALLIPFQDNGEKWVAVPGVPSLRYRRSIWSPRRWLIEYTDPQGVVHNAAIHGDGDHLFDIHGEVVGREMPDGSIALNLQAVLPGALKEGDPRACPAPSPDKFGQGPDSESRAYEDYVKSIVNPPSMQTPSGMGMALFNLATGQWVIFDDCEHASGTMIEAKSHRWTLILQEELKAAAAGKRLPWNVVGKMLGQADRQVQAAGSHHIRWYFEDEFAANFARELFADTDRGRERIEVVYLPNRGAKK